MWLDWITGALVLLLVILMMLERRLIRHSRSDDSIIVHSQFRHFLRRRLSGMPAVTGSARGWEAFATERLFHAETQAGICIEDLDAITWVGLRSSPGIGA